MLIYLMSTHLDSFRLIFLAVSRLLQSNNPLYLKTLGSEIPGLRVPYSPLKVVYGLGSGDINT